MVRVLKEAARLPTIGRIAWLMSVVLLAGTNLVIPAQAQGGQCTQACQSSFAQCYKATGSNRKVCEAQLQQCLSGCINKR